MDFSFNNNTKIISNAIIDSITVSNRTLLVTVMYDECIDCNVVEQTLRLVVDSNTRITDENRNQISATNLEVGMTINAIVTAVMTRSIPPQANALQIQVVARPLKDETTIGRILETNRQDRYFTTISGNNGASIIRFNVPKDALIYDNMGRPIDFSRLIPGRRVWVRHAAFMTASIPPQTTAFEIRLQ